MPELKFFGIRDDLEDVFEFIYRNTDFHVFESYSQYDKELQEYKNTKEIMNLSDIGRDNKGNGAAYLFSLWSPSVMSKPNIKRIELKVPRHSFRYSVEGCGLFWMQIGGIYHNIITPSSITFFTEKGAYAKCSAKPGPDDVNWKTNKELSGKLRYHTQRRLKEKAIKGGGVVMKKATTLLQDSIILKDNKYSTWSYEIAK
jgi:hypothetical protein